MPDKDKKIMTACADLVKRMSESEKDRFLTFTEGMAFMNARMTCDRAPAGMPEKKSAAQ